MSESYRAHAYAVLDAGGPTDAGELAALVGCQRNTAALCIRTWRQQPVQVERLPLRTRAGTMWAQPIQPPDQAAVLRWRREMGLATVNACDCCPRQERCREAVARGDFIGCERALPREILHDDATLSLVQAPVRATGPDAGGERDRDCDVSALSYAVASDAAVRED